MNDILEFIIKCFLILLHLFVIWITAITILFSEDIYILTFLLVIQIIVFALLVVNNGCLMSRFELIGGDFLSSTLIGKKLFFLSDGVKDADFEKIFVGVPLLLILLKIVMVAFPVLPMKQSSDKYWCMPKIPVMNNTTKFLRCLSKPD